MENTEETAIRTLQYIFNFREIYEFRQSECMMIKTVKLIPKLASTTVTNFEHEIQAIT